MAVTAVCTHLFQLTTLTAPARKFSTLLTCHLVVDVDDVGTLAVLNAMADSGEAELLAVILSTMPKTGAGAISSIQTYYNRNVPIGAFKGEIHDPEGHARLQHHYVDELVDRWPGPVHDSNQVVSSTIAYRAALSAQPDQSVVVAVVGMHSALAALFRPGPDDFSPHTGKELFYRKVRLLSVMGGEFPNGFECNLCGDRESANFITAALNEDRVNNTHLQTGLRVVYIGKHAGLTVMSGASLHKCAPEDSPIRYAVTPMTDSNHSELTESEVTPYAQHGPVTVHSALV